MPKAAILTFTSNMCCLCITILLFCVAIKSMARLNIAYRRVAWSNYIMDLSCRQMFVLMMRVYSYCIDTFGPGSIE